CERNCGVIQEKLGKLLDLPADLGVKGRGKTVEVTQIPVIQGKHWKTERGCLGAHCLQGRDWPQHIGCPLSWSGRNSPPFWSGRRHQSSVLKPLGLRPPSLWVASVWGTFSGSL
ncbi:unnamed protein product, partial [Rangifer tarandus platyrhynchus]